MVLFLSHTIEHINSNFSHKFFYQQKHELKVKQYLEKTDVKIIEIDGLKDKSFNQIDEITEKIEPYFMARIVDVEKFLEKYKPEENNYRKIIYL